MSSIETLGAFTGLAVVMIAGTLSLPKIVEAQNAYTGTIAHWHVFTPWGLAGFILFFIASLAGDIQVLPPPDSNVTGGVFSSCKYTAVPGNATGPPWGTFTATGSNCTVTGVSSGAGYN